MHTWVRRLLFIHSKIILQGVQWLRLVTTGISTRYFPGNFFFLIYIYKTLIRITYLLSSITTENKIFFLLPRLHAISSSDIYAPLPLYHNQSHVPSIRVSHILFSARFDMLGRRNLEGTTTIRDDLPEKFWYGEIWLEKGQDGEEDPWVRWTSRNRT